MRKASFFSSQKTNIPEKKNGFRRAGSQSTVFYMMASWRGISGNTLCANKGKFCNYFAESLRSLFDVSSSLSRSLPFPEGSKAAKQYSTTSSIKAEVRDSYFFMRLDFYARDQGDVFDSGCNCMKVIYFLLLQFHF